MTEPMILTANTRLARVLRQDYDRKQIADGQKVWTPPDILPISAWLERCWRSWIYATDIQNPVQLLSDSQELAIWEDIVARSDAGGELLQVAPTAEAAASAWLLAQEWRVPLEAPDWDSSKDTEAFRGWANEFQRICRKRNCISKALLPDFVAAKIASDEIPVPPHTQLAGFTEFTPVQEQLFESIRRKSATVETLKAPERGGRESAVRVEFGDSLQEIRSAARWARRRLELAVQSMEAEPTIGVVVPELSKYRSAIERLFAEELHPAGRMSPDRDSRRAFNISLGPALSEYPLIQSALRVLRMNPSDDIPFDDVTILLRSPFIAKTHTEEAACAALDLRLRSMKEPELAHSDVSASAPPGLKSALRTWELEHAKTSGRQFPSVWSAAFARELISVGWPGERSLNSAEHQTAVAWNTLLSEFAALDSVTEAISRSRAMSMLQRSASARQFQPESEPAPVQILGVLEASGMSFDHLWIIGMHDGVWPRSTNPNPFLPLRLQRRLNLPQSSAARELEFSRLLTEQLLASSHHVVVSHPSKEGDADLRPSPLLSSILAIFGGKQRPSEAPGYAQQLYGTQDIEKIPDSTAPNWNGTKAGGGTSIFKHQAACPFRAFARIRLGAEPLESAVPGLSPLDRGNLVHDVLKVVWEELGSHETLITGNAAELGAVVHEAVEACIRKMSLKRRVLREPRFAAIEQARLESLASEWLELEKRRRPFEVISLEKQHSVNVGGIDFTIRADRIDRMDDGSYIVVDYKTSPQSPKVWDGDRPDDPQLPLYAITAGVVPAGVAFAVLKTGESKFAGLASSDGILPGIKAATGGESLTNRIPQWRGVLEALAADFRSGKAAVDPKKPNQTCRHCGLDSLCRISEANLRDESVDEPGGEVADD